MVVLILRGRENVGSTFLNVLKRYAETLQNNGGQLILAEVSEAVHEQLKKTGMLEIIGTDNVLPARPLLLASLQEALAIGQRRLSELGHADEEDADQGALSQ